MPISKSSFQNTPGQLESMSGSEIGTDVGVVGLDSAVVVTAAAAAAAAAAVGGTGGVRFLLTDLIMSGDESVVRLEMAPAVVDAADVKAVKLANWLEWLLLTGRLAGLAGAGSAAAQVAPPVRVEQLLGVEDRLLRCLT